MALNDSDILLLSLLHSGMGGDVDPSVPEPLIPWPVISRPSVPGREQASAMPRWQQPFANVGFFPVGFELPDGTRIDLPGEPLVSVSGRNKIIRRYTARPYKRKMQGSIKEYFVRDDWEIQIAGILVGPQMRGTPEDTYPREDMERLRELVTLPGSLKIYCEPLQLLGINRVVIERFDFPFTKGENAQKYKIKAYSDFEPEYLLEINE